MAKTSTTTNPTEFEKFEAEEAHRSNHQLKSAIGDTLSTLSTASRTIKAVGDILLYNVLPEVQEAKSAYLKQLKN